MRKGHGSTKVPNVKLRPPPARAASSSKASSSKKVTYESHDEDSMEVEEQPLDLKRAPFQGVHLCTTGVKEKAILMKQAADMGASTSHDFTDRVTHLLACTPGSAKYQCALENRIPIMDPAWVTETHRAWLSGVDMSFEDTVFNYRLPPFVDCRMVITGETDLSRRQELGRLIRKGGAKYQKDTDDKITHVICCSVEAAEGSEKVEWARQINAKRRQKKLPNDQLIKIVWEEWVWDCIEWQGKWDESKHRIENPRPQRNRLPLPTLMEEPSFNVDYQSTQHPRHQPSAAFPAEGEGDVEFDEEQPIEVAKVRRPADSNGGIKAKLEKQLWEEISSATQGLNPRKGKGKAAAVDEEQAQNGKRERPATAHNSDTESDKEVLPKKWAAKVRGSVLAESSSTSTLARMSVTRADSFAPSAPSRGMQRISSTSKLLATSSEPVAPPKVFTGLQFRTLGQASLEALVTSVEENGGSVIKSEPGDDLHDADYIIVRLQEAALFCSNGHPLIRRFRTECWVESCIFEERLCEPEEHVVFAPLAVPVPIIGASAISLVWTGLDNSQTYHLRRLCKAIGVNLPDKFSPKTTHLICPSRTGQKFEKAQQWGVPVVDLEWLWHAAKTGTFADVNSTDVPGPIMDITNDSSHVKQASSVQSLRPITELDEYQAVSDAAEDVFGVPDPTIFYSSYPKSNGSAIKSTPRGRQPPNGSPEKSEAGTMPNSPTKPSTSASSGSIANLVAFLGKRIKDDTSQESTGPPKKKTRPTTRAKPVKDGQIQSFSASELSPSTSTPLPFPIGSLNIPDEPDESMRVLYHDPAQQAEKQRLMSLIGAGSTSPPPVEASRTENRPSKSAPRRSTRRAGF